MSTALRPVEWNAVAGQAGRKYAGNREDPIEIASDDEEPPVVVPVPNDRQHQDPTNSDVPLRAVSQQVNRREGSTLGRRRANLRSRGGRSLKTSREPSLSSVGTQPHEAKTTTTSFAAPLHATTLSELSAILTTALAKGHLTESVVRNALSHLTPDVYPKVQRAFEQRTSMSAFVGAVQQMLVERPPLAAKLGIEMSLSEFKRHVLQEVAHNTSGDPEEMIEDAIAKLGPETNDIVMEAWMTRTDLPNFYEEVAQLDRPRGPSAFTQEEVETITQSLIDSEGKLTYQNMDAVQTVVTHRMRGILVDWLIDVAERFKCCSETLHLAVALTDRFLMMNRVAKAELQLLGVSAMLLASKYEMVYPPELRDFIYIAACTYTKEDIVRMERQLFVALEFNVTIPTTNALANCILGQQDPTPTAKQRSVVSFLLETMLVAAMYNSTPPHVIACACVFLSRVWCQIAPASEVYIPHEVLVFVPTVVGAVRDLNGPNSRLAAVRNKFSTATRHFVGAEAVPNQVWALAPSTTPLPPSPTQ